MEKFKFLEETIKLLGLSKQEVINYLSENSQNALSFQSCSINIAEIKPGMFWFEDDVFSYERQENKKIKAIVELVENGVIYGDLTASELFNIKEQELPWDKAKKYIKEFSYPCQENEKIVWYDIGQLEKVYGIYEVVKQAFRKVGKPFRKRYYWSSTENLSMYAWIQNFFNGYRYTDNKYDSGYVRPVLALKIYWSLTIKKQF